MVLFQANLLTETNLHAEKYLCGGYALRRMSSFGENVKRLRLAIGLKGVDLAARAGVTPPVVSAWENDRGGLPESPTLLKLAKILRVTVHDLLEGIDEEYDRVAATRIAEVIAAHANEPERAPRADVTPLAFTIAKWFDALPPTRQRAIIDVLGIHMEAGSDMPGTFPGVERRRGERREHHEQRAVASERRRGSDRRMAG